jgi:hypothetical protein
MIVIKKYAISTAWIWVADALKECAVWLAARRRRVGIKIAAITVCGIEAASSVMKYVINPAFAATAWIIVAN